MCVCPVPTHPSSSQWQQPIVSADDSSHLAVLNELVSAGADVNARDRHGDAAIAVCCQNGYQQCVAALLDAGAHPGATPGRSPMSYAARFGAAGCIRVLRKFNAEVAHKDAREAWTPLHDAAETGFVECVRALLDIGASVNACDGDKMTPLHVAARFGQADCARVLLLAGAIVDARNTVRSREESDKSLSFPALTTCRGANHLTVRPTTSALSLRPKRRR